MVFKRKVITYIISILILSLIVMFIYYYRVKIGKILTPFFIAVVIAYMLHPLVIRLERKKISRTVGILLIYLGFISLIVSITIFIVPELINNTKELMNTLPDITARYQAWFNNLISSLQSKNWSPDVKNALFKEIQGGSITAQSFVTDILRKSLSKLVTTLAMLLDFAIAMFIAYYFIKDAGMFKEGALSLTPRKWRNNIIATGREINGVLSSFIQGQLLTALIVGTMETIGLLFVKIKYPLVLGLIGGLANIIPYFGPFLGAIPAIAVALIESPMKAVWTALVFVIVQQIDNSFISPKVIEGKLGLHPLTTVMAVLVGGEFFGILGMLVSVPVAAIIKILIKRTVDAIV